MGHHATAARTEPDVFDWFEPYVRQRLKDDPHVRATVLFAEAVGLGFDRSCQTFTRQLRDRQLRPHCEPCASSNSWATWTSSIRRARRSSGTGSTELLALPGDITDEHRPQAVRRRCACEGTVSEQ
jgi:hypothetical protein